MDVAIPIFDGLTALDAIGPYEVLSRLPDAHVHFLAAEPGPKRTGNQMLAFTADAALDDLRTPDVIVMPGGHGTRALMHDEQMLGWVRAAHVTSRWTTSVCTGSLAPAIQLAIEYDPEPPFDSGSTSKASPAVLELARARA